MNPYENDPREPIKEWEGIVEDVECGGCERTILSAHAVFGGYANGDSDACWACHFCDTENLKKFEAVEVNAELSYFAKDGNYGNADEIVIVDTSKWTGEEWAIIEENSDHDRPAVARQLAEMIESGEIVR
jgi:hypothetical protein